MAKTYIEVDTADLDLVKTKFLELFTSLESPPPSKELAAEKFAETIIFAIKKGYINI